MVAGQVGKIAEPEGGGVGKRARATQNRFLTPARRIWHRTAWIWPDRRLMVCRTLFCDEKLVAGSFWEGLKRTDWKRRLTFLRTANEGFRGGAFLNCSQSLEREQHWGCDVRVYMTFAGGV
jgi:hypothetical protein